MNKEKQIEEMGKELLRAYAINKLYSEDVAKHLYNAGYRKQSEGEWIYSEDEVGNSFYRCSICDCQTRYKENYCASCGAKMKGGAE